MVRLLLAVMVSSAAALAALTGCGTSESNKAGGVQSRAVVLALADGETDTSNAKGFADAVKHLSGGTLLIAIKSPWRQKDPSYETDLIKDVEAGRAQLGISASRAFDTVGIDTFQALQAPFLIDSVALERRVLSGDLASRMLAGVSKHGLFGLAILPGPVRRPMGFSKALMSVADYRRARIGVRLSLVTEETIRALGAKPVVLPGPYYNAPAGLAGVEGHLTNLDMAFPLRGATVTGNVDLEPRPNVIFMNRHAFESLNPAQRRILVNAAAQVRLSAGIYEPDASAARDLCRRGIKIVAASSHALAGLRAAVQPVYTALESNPSTKALIDEIAALRQSLGGAPDVASCKTASTAAGIAQPGGQLEGKWQVTYSEEQLNAAGADPSEDLPVNWGHQTLTLDRGRWSNVGPPVGPNHGPASGTYVVHGDEITFYRHDHAYPGSNTEIWGPYTWSVYRDTLTFRKGNDFGAGPTGLVVEPWRRF